MQTTTPDFDWYSAKSAKVNGPKRCPFASANRCPRYYESIYLLGVAGITTRISDKDVVELDTKWKGFEANIGEEAASVSGGEENDAKAMSNFCPEVSYKIFGYFASGLYPHHGEIDRNLAHERLIRDGASHDDPNWLWADITPRHYAECPEFSILSHLHADLGKDKQNMTDKQTSPVSQNIYIQHQTGAIGNFHNSQVVIYDYASIHQKLVEQNMSKEARRELEDMLDEVKTASATKRQSLSERLDAWFEKHKGILGAATEIVAKVVECAKKSSA